MQRQQRRHRFQSARGAQRVPVHGLGGADHQLASVFTENISDSFCFGDIIGSSARSMGIDVTNRIGRGLGISQRGAHRTGGPFGKWLGQVVRVRGHSEACDLPPDARSTGLRVVQRLKQQHPGAFPQDQPSPVARNGRQVSGATIRMASHAFRKPSENGVSAPPAMAASAIPFRTIQNACPIA